MSTTKEDIKESATPSAASETPERKKGGVGCIVNERHMLYWNFTENLDVYVTGDEDAPGEWTVMLYSNRVCKFQGTVLGGRWCAAKLCQFLRNAMTARRMKKRRQTESRKARAAAALSPEAELAETVKRQQEMEG